MLYLIEILHQTTTRSLWPVRTGMLYLIEILHQTTTACVVICFQKPVVSYRNSTSNHNKKSPTPLFIMLYLIEILHQTTTKSAAINRINGCILSKFYIKPQLCAHAQKFARSCILSKFYIKPQLQLDDSMGHDQLYLIEILHQTTTMADCPP